MKKLKQILIGQKVLEVASVIYKLASVPLAIFPGKGVWLGFHRESHKNFEDLLRVKGRDLKFFNV
jgi:hypothetical protein